MGVAILRVTLVNFNVALNICSVNHLWIQKTYIHTQAVATLLVAFELLRPSIDSFVHVVLAAYLFSQQILMGFKILHENRNLHKQLLHYICIGCKNSTVISCSCIPLSSILICIYIYLVASAASPFLCRFSSQWLNRCLLIYFHFYVNFLISCQQYYVL